MRSIQMTLSFMPKYIHLDLGAMDKFGKFKHATAVFLLRNKNYEYVVGVKQSTFADATEMKLMRRDVSSGEVHWFSCFVVDHIPYVRSKAKPKPIVPIVQYIDKLCPSQISLFTDTESQAEFDRMLAWIGRNRGKNELVDDIDLDSAPAKTDTTQVEIFYKSECTQLNHVPHKIIMFVARDGDGRNDVYAVSYPCIEGDTYFKLLMAFYKSNSHGKFMNALDIHAGNKFCDLQRVPAEIRECSAICLTQPKSEEGIHDTSFVPMRAYRLLSSANNMDQRTYLSLINEDNEQVDRRANHFIIVPSRLRLARAA